MNIKKIGTFIANRRKEFGYTQDDLGDILGVSGKAVSKWERGLSLPDATLFNKLAVTLKVSVANLLSGSVEDTSMSSNNNLNLVECSTFPEISPVSYLDFTSTSNIGIVSPFLFGNNLEHTRSCVNKGLSAQMLRNRKFVGKPSSMEGIAQERFVIGNNTFCAFGPPYTHHTAGKHHMMRPMECNAQDVLCCEDNVAGGIGQHGLYIDSEKTYDFAIVARCINDVCINIALTDHNGENTYASTEISIIGGSEWHRYTATLKPKKSDKDADLRITFNKRECISIGAVSLMNHDNFHGMRKDVIEEMKKLGISLLRWPGGNYAGEYNWFDGLLPVDERAPFGSHLNLETHPHTLGFDFHEINTDDFISLCREIGAEPFITINIIWNTPEESAAWVEYCNGDITTEYGRIRAERGHPEPYNVLFWSLGNEMGYGHMEGEKTPVGYSRLARKNADQMLEVYKYLTLCSSGPYPDEEWSTYSAKPLSDIAPLVSLHNYSPEPLFYDLSNLREEYKKCISGVIDTRNKIRQLRSTLPDSQKISFDEWNAWYGWYRPSNIIDGMHAALMMHMFIGEANISNVAIACHFQAVNESAIKINADSAELSAVGRMLGLMSRHANAPLLYADEFAVSTKKDNRIILTLINPSCDDTVTFRGNHIGNIVNSELYVGKTLLPLSNFENDNLNVVLSSDGFEITIPPISVALIEFEV